MANTEYELRNDGERIWAHRVKNNGSVSQAGSVVSAEEAERMIATGEGAYAVAKPAAKPARLSREQYERAVQDQVDAGQPVSIEHWNAAMNRDD